MLFCQFLYVNHSHRQSFYRDGYHFHFYMQKYFRLLNAFESSSPKGFDAKIFLFPFQVERIFPQKLAKTKAYTFGHI